MNFGGELYLSRRLDVTAAQLAEADGEARERLLERVLIETQRSLDHCERTYPFFRWSGWWSARCPATRLARAPGRQPLSAGRGARSEQLVRLPAAAAGWTPEQQAKWLKLIGAGLRVEKKAL